MGKSFCGNPLFLIDKWVLQSNAVRDLSQSANGIADRLLTVDKKLCSVILVQTLFRPIEYHQI